MIVVTGGCGFIGSNFIKSIKGRYPIINIDCLGYSSNTAINEYMRDDPNYTFICGNLNDPRLLRNIFDNHNVDTVVHFAAQSHVDASFDNPMVFANDNIIGTLNLLEECRMYGKLKKFVFISTDEVYGDSIEYKTEDAQLNPTNPYSATKAAAEMLCTSYKHSFKLPIVITRSNNVYGPWQYKEKLIPKFIDLLKYGQKCTIHGTGDVVRSFIHVSDVCRAILLVLEKGIIGEIYNIGSCDELSVNHIAELLVRKIKGTNAIVEDWVTFVRDRFYNDARYNINYDKIKSMGWKPSVSFDDGISRLL